MRKELTDTIINHLNKVEENPEGVNSKPGETLDHFIAMMNMNAIKFTKENITASIEFGLQFEEEEYLTYLKNDINYKDVCDVNDEALLIIKDTIRNY